MVCGGSLTLAYQILVPVCHEIFMGHEILSITRFPNSTSTADLYCQNTFKTGQTEISFLCRRPYGVQEWIVSRKDLKHYGYFRKKFSKESCEAIGLLIYKIYFLTMM